MPGHQHLRPADGHTVGVEVSRPAVTAILVLLGLAAVATMIGLVRLWPAGDVELPSGVAPGNVVEGTTRAGAEVTRVEPFACDSLGDLGVDSATTAPDGSGRGDGSVVPDTCAHITATVTEGAGEGETAEVDVSPAVVKAQIAPGDGVTLLRIPTLATQGDGASYAFSDLQRGRPMTMLAIAFAVAVVAVARWRGLRALIGLAVAGYVLVEFMLPALLQGSSGLAVGVVGSAAILFVVLYLAHGPSVRTSTALAGTLIGVALTALIGQYAVEVSRLTGFGSEETGELTALAGQVSLRGLLVCGVIVAGLGVLNDVTITQASAVWELRAADPGLSRRHLYTAAMRIGRDHIASTVYTVVFAYAGAALVTLLLIEILQFGLADVLVTETLAEEVVRTLASGIGLVLAVPVTTAVAVLATATPR